MDLKALRAELARTPSVTPAGRVRAVTGLAVRATLPGARIGEVVRIRRRGEPLDAEIVGFSSGEIVALALGDVVGVGPDDIVEATGEMLQIRVGAGLLGRVLDGLGRPIDGQGPIEAGGTVPVDRAPPPALERRAVTHVLPTGVRALDAFATLGQGQRVGLFAGSGVGKSRLLGAMARGAAVDVVVVALVGERGREVGDFLRENLAEEQDKRRAVVVVSTSDAPALERLRAAQVATAIAESFRDQGQNVLLLVDSITRVARAQRDVGLAAGEPPVRRGYPPSVFSMLPRLLERSGQAAQGAITAIYTVLVEGDDLSEPIADEVRGLLDGHIILDRELAARGHYPAIDVLRSLSRVMGNVTTEQHQRAARSLRELIAAHESKRDLIALGAYVRGKDPAVDRALLALPDIQRFLCQEGHEVSRFEETLERLQKLGARYAE